MHDAVFLDIFLAFLILFFSASLGRLLLEYKNEYQPLASLFEAEKSVGSNAIIRISIAPICIVIFSILLYWFHFDRLVKEIWMVAVYYLVLQSFLLSALSRWPLVNISKYVSFHLISILLSYYLYQALITKGLSHLLPDEANLRTDMWLLIAGFFYGIFRLIPENGAAFSSRKRTYIVRKAKRLSKKYGSSLSSYDSVFRDVLLAVMIYEDYNRPRVIRIFENILKTNTRGIMQVRGATTDEESINRAAAFLRKHFKGVTVDADGTIKDYSAFYKLFAAFNPGDPTYSSEVVPIFLELRKPQPSRQNILNKIKKYRLMHEEA